MDGIVVLARCKTDDVPMGLFKDPKVARGFALVMTEDDVIAVADETMDIDVSEVYSVYLMSFVDGEPISFKQVKMFAAAM